MHYNEFIKQLFCQCVSPKRSKKTNFLGIKDYSNLKYIPRSLPIVYKYPFPSKELFFIQYSLLFPNQQRSSGPILLFNNEKTIPILGICTSPIEKSIAFKINNDYYWMSGDSVCYSDVMGTVFFKIESSQTTLILI